MSELGRRLRLEREKKGISIQEVGLSLKINPRVIGAMEDGDRDLLPAVTFLRGFVKSYAQFLRMDTKETLDLFNTEYATVPLHAANINTDPNAIPSEQPPKSEVLSTPAPQKTSLADQGTSLAKENITNEAKFPVGKLIIGVVLFVLVIVLAKLINKYQKERVLPADTAAVTADANADVDADSVVTDNDLPAAPAPSGFANPVPFAEAGTGETTIIQSNTSSAPVSTQVSSTPMPTPTPAPTATPAPAATPTPAPTATPRQTPTPTPTPKVTPTPATSAATLERPVEVMVEVSKSVRVRYDLGDGKITTLDLNAGDVHTFRSKSPIALDISNGSALNLIVNGRDHGKAGSSEQPVKLRLPE